MAEDAVPMIVASYEALNRRDTDATLAVLADEVIWRESSELPGAGELHGKEAVHAFLDEFLETWEEFEQRVERTELVGERVAVFLHMRGVGRGSGIEVDTRYAHVWTVRDGKGARVDAYRDPDDARRALERPANEP
jgi:ketosteroid isomerase-like protein